MTPVVLLFTHFFFINSVLRAYYHHPHRSPDHCLDQKHPTPPPLALPRFHAPHPSRSILGSFGRLGNHPIRSIDCVPCRKALNPSHQALATKRHHLFMVPKEKKFCTRRWILSAVGHLRPSQQNLESIVSRYVHTYTQLDRDTECHRLSRPDLTPPLHLFHNKKDYFVHRYPPNSPRCADQGYSHSLIHHLSCTYPTTPLHIITNAEPYIHHMRANENSFSQTPNSSNQEQKKSFSQANIHLIKSQRIFNQTSNSLRKLLSLTPTKKKKPLCA